ncbi:MAG TPA: DUF2723 domain-containing protein [Patescibacteria group bacterium]|nr:DUF2723 domain-containing protein [Patescibacteria group bacterium]
MILALPVLAFFSFLYLLTASPTIVGFDSGDMVTASSLLGVAHPPGYPLYTMIGFLFSKFPIAISVVGRLNVMSALMEALSLSLLFLAIRQVTKQTLPPLLAVLYLGVSYIYWYYGLFAEVFALSNLLLALLLLVSIHIISSASKGKNHVQKYFFLFSFFLGLSLTHHHIVLFSFPFFALLWWEYRKKVVLSLKTLLFSVLSFFAGFLPYLYIPIAASRNPVVNWENAVTLRGFFDLITRARYGTFTAVSDVNPAGGFERLKQVQIFFDFLKDDLGLIGITLGILGFVYLVITKSKLFWPLLAGFFTSGPFFLFYANFPTGNVFYYGVMERFLMTSYIFFSLSIAFGIVGLSSVVAWITQRAAFLRSRSEIFTLFVQVLLILPLIVQLIDHYGKVDLSSVYLGERMARDMLYTVEKNAILYVTSDTPYFNLLYLHEVENVRPDVKLISPHFVSQRYYRSFLAKTYPDLVIDVEGKETPLTLIEKNVDSLIFYSWGFDPVVQGRTWKQDGLVEKLVLQDEPVGDSDYSHKVWTHLLRDPEDLRSIQGNLNFELVNEMYFSSLTNTAALFVQKEDLETAISYYLLAKSIRPWEATAEFNLGVVYARMKNCGEAEGMFLSAHRQFPYRIEPLQNLKVLYEQCSLSTSKAEAVQQEIDILTKSLQTPLKTYW